MNVNGSSIALFFLWWAYFTRYESLVFIHVCDKTPSLLRSWASNRLSSLIASDLSHWSISRAGGLSFLPCPSPCPVQRVWNECLRRKTPSVKDSTGLVDWLEVHGCGVGMLQIQMSWTIISLLQSHSLPDCLSDLISMWLPCENFGNVLTDN